MKYKNSLPIKAVPNVGVTSRVKTIHSVSMTLSLMAEFTANLQSLKPSSLEMSSNMEMMNNRSAPENSHMNGHRFMSFSNVGFSIHQQHEFPVNFRDDAQSLVHAGGLSAVQVLQFSSPRRDFGQENKSGKVSVVSSSLASGSEFLGDNKVRVSGK